jgi:hypothetical protein
MNSNGQGNLNQQSAVPKPSFTARLYWLISHTLVQEGVPDAWHVRINGKSLEGRYALHQISEMQSADPCAVVEMSNAEQEGMDGSTPAWTPVHPDSGLASVLGRALTCFCVIAGALLGVYIFTGSHGHWAKRFVWAGSAGLASVFLLRPTFTHLLASFAWFCHLFGDHRRAFLRGAALGGTAGALAGSLLWDFSDGALAGLLITLLLGIAAGLLAGAARAQTDHERCVQAVTAQDSGGPANPSGADLLPARGQNRGVSATDITRALLAASFITLLTVPIPLQQAGTGVEASWSSVLNYAHQKGWQFGTDIVYTYGPLGFLASPYYSSNSVALQMAAKTALSFVVAVGVCLVAWQLRLLWKWLLLCLYAFFSASIHAEGISFAGTDLSIYVGLLCWGVLCTLESRRRLVVYCLCFTALAVFGTLVKINLIVPAAPGVAAIAGALTMRDRRKLGRAMVIGYGLGLLAGWLAAGQELKHLSSFVSQGFEIARGYHDAMSRGASSGVIWTSILTALFALAAIAIPSAGALGVLGRKTAWPRMLLCGWLYCLWFVVWKYGVIRASHFQLNVFTAFMPILALVMVVLADDEHKRRTWAGGLSIACALMAFMLLDATFYRGYTSFCLSQPVRLLRWNMRCLLRPTQDWKPEASSVPLPKICGLVGRSSVDVFGCEQACALINHLEYRPRPVFQTMAAYTAPLMSLNEQFYLSKAAPDYVLFELDAIDKRFPPLEDAMVLRDLLINYERVEAEGHFLLFKSRAAARPKMTLVREDTARPGERIALSALGDANLWMEIRVEPTLAGKLLRFVYKSPPVNLWVWRDAVTSGSKKFCAPRPMLSSGFLASPLLLDNNDVEDLCTGSRITRPYGYSVELPPGTQRFWQDTIRFRIYRIENQLGRCPPATLRHGNQVQKQGGLALLRGGNVTAQQTFTTLHHFKSPIPNFFTSAEP